MKKLKGGKNSKKKKRPQRHRGGELKFMCWNFNIWFFGFFCDFLETFERIPNSYWRSCFTLLLSVYPERNTNSWKWGKESAPAAEGRLQGRRRLSVRLFRRWSICFCCALVCLWRQWHPNLMVWLLFISHILEWKVTRVCYGLLEKHFIACVDRWLFFSTLLWVKVSENIS